MKHHVHTLILLASLTITWLLCSCRTTYQKDRSAQEQSNLSISDSTLYDRTGDIYSRFNFNTLDDVNLKRIFYSHDGLIINKESQPIEYRLELKDRRFAEPINSNEIYLSRGQIQQNTY